MSFDDENFDWQDADDDLQHGQIRIEQLPVMRKGKEIFRIVRSIVDTIPEDADLQYLREAMLTDAATIPAKIAGAEGGNMYTLRMENAVLIKLSARALIVHTYTCELFSISDKRYMDLLRATIDEFRIVFAEWIETFDKDNDMEDGWGAMFR